MQKQDKFTLLSSKELFLIQRKGSLFAFIEAIESRSNRSKALFSSNQNILLSEIAYALNRQLVVQVEADGSQSAVQHGFKRINTSRAADNCKLFKIRFKSIIKHPV